jgi:hypothetical protein
MADRRPPRQMRAPANSRLRESCSRPAVAGGATAQLFAMWWTASKPLWQSNITAGANAMHYYTGLRKANSSDIHDSEITLQHAGGTVSPSSCPSNREGFWGQSRGLRAVLFAFPRIATASILRWAVQTLNCRVVSHALSRRPGIIFSRTPPPSSRVSHPRNHD